MSAYSETATEFKDGDLLMAALTDMGFKPVNHIGNPQRLEGYHGDLRQQVADIIIPRRQVGGSSNDLGFVKGADGTFRAIISDYDSTRYNAQWLNKVKVGVADAGILRTAKKAGLRLLSRKQNEQTKKIEYQFLRA